MSASYEAGQKAGPRPCVFCKGGYDAAGSVEMALSSPRRRWSGASKYGWKGGPPVHPEWRSFGKQLKGGPPAQFQIGRKELGTSRLSPGFPGFPFAMRASCSSVASAYGLSFQRARIAHVDLATAVAPPSAPVQQIVGQNVRGRVRSLSSSRIELKRAPHKRCSTT